MNEWIPTRCAICDGVAPSRPLFAVAHPDAPGGSTAVVQCTACGLRRLDPRPGSNTVGKYYGSSYYAYQGRRRAPWRQWLWNALRDSSSGYTSGPIALTARPVTRAITNWRFDVNVPPPARESPYAVDIGCGYGDLLMYLQSRGWTVQGTDLDAGAAALGAKLGVPIHVGELEELALDAASVDVAILQHSLEHVADPRSVIRELARVVRPGGTLHIAVPNGDAVGLAVEKDSWGCLSPPLHFWYFDRRTLSALVEEHGFRVSDIRYKTIWVNHKNLWRAELRRAGAAAVLKQAGRVLAVLSRDSARGDTLRVVARRRPDVITAALPRETGAAPANRVEGGSSDHGGLA